MQAHKEPHNADEKRKRLFMRAMVTFTNNLLGDKENRPQTAGMQLQALCDKLKIDKTIYLCDHCCSMIGYKKCSGCAKNDMDTYYCSKECQEAAWPSHQLVCKKKLAKTDNPQTGHD